MDYYNDPLRSVRMYLKGILGNISSIICFFFFFFTLNGIGAIHIPLMRNN